MFYDILERKNAFLGYENKKLKKSKKLPLVQRGEPTVLVQNWPFFQLLFFRQYRPGQFVLRYFRTKNAFLSYKKQKLKKAKNCHFFNFFFLVNIGQENVFYDILERKDAFLGFKNKKFKKSKNSHFSKEVNPKFLSKNGHFLNFFWGGG